MPPGSHYKAAKLTDPAVIEVLLEAEELEDEDFPLVGWDQSLARMANIEDLLGQILYATARIDPAAAPRAVRAVAPHVKRRNEIKQQRRNANRAQKLALLVPVQGGDDGVEDLHGRPG